MFTENPMEREDVEESVKVETVRGKLKPQREVGKTHPSIIHRGWDSSLITFVRNFI